jgi:hypothetical protein
MKRIIFAALIALASCELIELAPNQFDPFFIQSYENGRDLGAAFRPNEQLPQQPLLYAMVGAGVNQQFTTFPITGEGTFCGENQPQFGGLRVFIGGTDTLQIFQNLDTLNTYFWFWEKGSWEAAGSPLSPNYQNAVQQASYTGDLKVGRVSLAEAQHALQVLAAQHGLSFPSDYYLSGVVMGVPDCIGYPRSVPQTRNQLISATGFGNSCILTDQSGFSTALVVQKADGTCRRIKNYNGATVGLYPWDVSCSPYSDTALARITIRVTRNSPQGQTSQALTGTWYRSDQQPSLPVFWLEQSFPSRWLEGRVLLQPKPGSSLEAFNSLIGILPGEKIIGVTGYSTEL